MRRSPLLSSVVWSTVSGASLLLAGCGDDGPSFADAAVVADARPADASSTDASLATAVFPAEVDTFAAECGVAIPDTVDIAIMNSGTQPLVIASATASNGFTVVTKVPVTIEPGASTALAVRPPESVIGTDIGGTVKLGALSFVTNENGAPTRTVTLRSTVNGANIELRAGSAADSPALTAIMMTGDRACPPPFDVFLRNTGDRPVQLNFPSGPGFNFRAYSPSSSLPPGEHIVGTLTASTSGDCEHEVQLAYSATGVACTEQPIQIQASYSITGDSAACFCS